MTRLYLVRHGRAAATFSEAADPGLDPLGQSQAEAVAKRLSSSLAPLPLLTSPLKRARETSVPLAALWQSKAVVEPAVAEIPSPDGLGLAERAEWLRGFMAGSWRTTSRELAGWREGVIAALASQERDSVIFSHFVAINVAAGAAARDDRVAIFRPGNCSVTIIDVVDGTLKLVELGHEVDTKVN